MEQFDRFTLLTKDQFSLIQNMTVMIVGLGGVGSYAVEALCRSGVSHLILVDHDQVDITNLNRQLMTLHSNIGDFKVDVWKDRICDINPNCQVDGMKWFLTEKTLLEQNLPHIDYIIDACDTVDAKIALIAYAKKHHIKLISSMGTGNKLDPTKLMITTLAKTEHDPLARVMRKKVRERGFSLDIPVVCSKELSISTGSHTIGSTAFVPSVAGLYCASYVVNDRLKSGDKNEEN